MTFGKKTYSPEALERMQTLIDELNGQTDRGVAIVGATWVEEAISESLASVLPQKKKSWERLFKVDGPLSSFSAKIDLLHLLGLTSELIRSDMHRLREIRNLFAHKITHKNSSQKLSFSISEIKDKCFALKCIEHEQIVDPRVCFIRACATLNADMEMVRYFGGTLLNDVGKVIVRNEAFSLE
jgi:DNA-binding MltR family transcriptional regulator